MRMRFIALGLLLIVAGHEPAQAAYSPPTIVMGPAVPTKDWLGNTLYSKCAVSGMIHWTNSSLPIHKVKITIYKQTTSSPPAWEAVNPDGKTVDATGDPTATFGLPDTDAENPKLDSGYYYRATCQFIGTDNAVKYTASSNTSYVP